MSFNKSQQFRKCIANLSRAKRVDRLKRGLASAGRIQLTFEPLEARRVLAGDLDLSFGDHGIVTTAVTTGVIASNESDRLERMALQSDGKILAVGQSNSIRGNDFFTEFSLVRYNSVGTLDLSFGGDGIVTVPLSAWASSLAVQSDGKILVAGAHYGQSIWGADFGLVRFNSDGSLDDGFGSAGRVQTPIARFGTATSVAIQSDGKIVVAGYAYTEIYADFALARYNSDGSLDDDSQADSTPGDGFGTSGIVMTQISPVEAGDYPATVLIQSDQKIVVVGYSYGANGGDTVAVRYNSDGSLDTGVGPNAFGEGGIATIPVSQADDGVSSAVLQPDGKIVIAGQNQNGTSGQYDFSFIRLDEYGRLDTGFGGGDGVVTTAIGVGYSGANAIALQSDGKFVLAGTSWNGTDIDFAIARYESDGSLESAFGGGDGIVTTPISNGINAGGGHFQADDFAVGVVIQADGDIVVAGTTVVQMQTCEECEVGSDTDFALVRYIGQDIDNDGVNETVEAAAPNGGDGNNDGTQDNQQINVTSLPSSTASASYLTLASAAGTQLAFVGAVPNPSPATVPPGVQFPIGHLDFTVAGVVSGGASTVTLFLPDDTQVNTYYKFGPTPDNSVAHWYPFLFDGTTGAIIDAGLDGDNLPEQIVLHFVDGRRGDDDLIVNGTIVDPGAPGFNTAPSLDTSGSPRLTTIPLNAIENPGTLVRDMLRRAKHLDLTLPPPYFPEPISDPDAGAVAGIAITAVDTSHGSWDYSTDAGATWQSLGSVSATASRLLAVDELSRVRFVPAPGFAGDVSAGITFRAWDQTEGSSGGILNATLTGDATSVSSQVETASITVAPAERLLTGLVTIGDSISSAYEFSPGRNTARTWVEQIETGRGINLGRFQNESWGAYRLQGREYMWGSPPPLSSTIIDGVIAQIASGEVTFVHYAFGQLHVASRYADIYNGVLAGPALTQLIDDAVAETAYALEAIAAAGDVKLTLQNWGEVGQTPLFRQVFPDAAKRQLVQDAVEEGNLKLQALADARGIPVVELMEISRLASSPEPLIVGGIELNKMHYQDFHADPTDFLEDALHPGTVVMGLIGNMFIEAANRAYGAGIAPLSDQEILVNAGITPPSSTPTYYDISGFVHFAQNFAPEIESLNSSNDTLANKSDNGLVTISGTFSDENPLDTHQVNVLWGDGTATEELTSVNQLTNVFDGGHTYQNGGIYTISVVVMDGDGALSQVQTTRVFVRGVGVVDGTLYVIGSNGEDEVDVKQKSNGTFGHVINAKGKFDKKGTKTSFDLDYVPSTIQQISIFLCGGDDDSKVHSNISFRALIDGGDGDDKLDGGSGDDQLIGGAGKDELKGFEGADILDGGENDDKLWGGKGNDILLGGDDDDDLQGGGSEGSDGPNDSAGDVLVGGNGNDKLKGTNGRNVLIGGFGRDDINGGAGDDLLIGGATIYDTIVESLRLIMAEWNSARTYDTRVDNLRNGAGPVLVNTGVRLKKTGSDRTILEDSDIDTLTGGNDRDWYFADLGLDVLKDKKANETID